MLRYVFAVFGHGSNSFHSRLVLYLSIRSLRVWHVCSLTLQFYLFRIIQEFELASGDVADPPQAQQMYEVVCGVDDGVLGEYVRIPLGDKFGKCFRTIAFRSSTA